MSDDLMRLALALVENGELKAKLTKAIAIAEVLSGAVEYDYHGNVLDPEERQAIKELDELIKGQYDA